MSNAELTEEPQADARRLAAILDAWKAENRRDHTQTRLARLCGWMQTTVSQYKHGVIPLNLEAALRFCRHLSDSGFRVAVADISPTLARQLPAYPGERLGAIQVDEAPSTPPWSTLHSGVPLISFDKASDRDAHLNNNPEDWIPSPGGHGPRAFFLRVEGDSMENPGGPHSFREGELILVDPDRRARHRDFVVAVVDGGRATFKQLIDADGERYLKAINPGWHRPRIDLPPGDRGIIDVAVKKIVDIA